jgi:kynureninase
MQAEWQKEAAMADASDEFASLRAAFILPEGVYLDGNSLGVLTVAARDAVQNALIGEWGQGLITSWNAAGWIDLAARCASRIEPIIGAVSGTVAVGDSTSINLFKVLGAIALKAGERRRIVTDAANFPTDIYIAEGVVRLLNSARGPGEHWQVECYDRSELFAKLDERVAAVVLTEVDYRTGERIDAAAGVRATHAVGAQFVLDLAHSAGALDVDLNHWDVDYAVGCGYKYLNGGPGAPAFLYVAPRHQATFVQPVQGWLGHAAPFEFAKGYRPAPGIERAQVGTPAVLSMTALYAALGVIQGVDMRRVRAKSLALTDFFMRVIEQSGLAARGLVNVTPRDPARRGSQVSFRHPQAYGLVQALIQRGVVGDFRAPDIARFGFAPFYLQFSDALKAALAIADCLKDGELLQVLDADRNAVT